MGRIAPQLIVCLTVANGTVAAQTHPLEPLTRAELTRAVQITRADSRFTVGSRFNIIRLAEPPKAAILAWKPGRSIPRQAFLGLWDLRANLATEVVVDLGLGTVTSWQPIPGAQGWLVREDEERLLADSLLRSDPRWLAAVRGRKLDPGSLAVFPGPAEGYLPFERDGTRRAVVLTMTKDGEEIPGLISQVNLTTRIVLSVTDQWTDQPIMPVRPGIDSLRALRATTKGTRPLAIRQPEGPSFRVTGHQVEWENWRFRFGVEPRSGLVLYQVGYQDGNAERSVLYRGAVSEMAVPYGDPGWHIWMPLDVGWVGLGNYSKTSFTVGADVPENARFFSSVMHDFRGQPVVVPRSVALYERDGGALWRHGSEARRSTELVLAFFATVDNYDYGFFWIFRQDGSLALEALLTGQMNVRSIHPGEHSAYGTVVAPGVFAPNHQHFFSVRLDLDVDGAGHNSVTEMNVIGEAAATDRPHGLRSEEHTFQRELEAQRQVNLESHRMWRIESTERKNRLGQPTAYGLIPEDNTVPMEPPGSFVRERVGFVNHHLWVTPFAENELFAAGDYAYLGAHGDGLPKWTAANRPIQDTDVVLWYTLGVTHVPRPEDWPVMPVVKTGFKLMPLGFFGGNPALGNR